MNKFNPDKKDEGSPFTNGQRAYLAQAAVAHEDDLKQRNTSATYPSEKNPPAPVDYDQVVDLLSDIAHLCDREGWDFRAILATVEMHHADER